MPWAGDEAVDDVLQNLIGLAADTAAPWWVKAALGGAGVAGCLYLRSRKQRTEEDVTLTAVHSKAYAALKRQITDQATTISQLQKEIQDLYAELRRQQEAEMSARKELGTIQVELHMTRQAMEEWATVWEQVQTQVKANACAECVLSHIHPPFIPQGVSP
ncbi:hypothetical protein D3877_23345 [Azospirillum cavernae]|uniref:Uncharacterized protein n=1 Tax=Azospirillum cavernae TaxID=2320860 RepID=A0A418VP69_9PROT|nr:hypothetical protein D3877_23345 [Azospirillum cavernae]